MKSTRLRYEKLSDEHFHIFYKINSNEEVMYYAYFDHIQSEEEARKLFDESLADDNLVMYAVYECMTEEGIGIVEYITDVGEVHHSEIGYFILPKFWGKGYGYEMSQWLIDDYFESTNFQEICASCHGNNVKSEGLMMKLGMTKTSVEKNGRFKRGEYVDEIRYSLNRNQWLKNKEEN